MAELGDDDVGAAGKSYACERRASGRAQLSLAARVAPEAKGVTGMGLHGERHVVEDREIEEQRGDLERAGEAELAAAKNRQTRDIAAREADASRVGRDLAGELANQRGLAGAVRSDDRVQLALRNGERNRVGGNHAAEALAEIFDFQERVSHGAPRRADRQCRRARTARPAGTADRG